MCKAEKNKVNFVSFELSPEWDNIAKSYIENPKARNRDVYDLVQLICSIDSHASIAIDGEWGCGKTFYVKQAKLLMDIYNDCINDGYIDKQYKESLKTSDSKPIEDIVKGNPHVCVYYDAWSNDNHEDPIFSLVYSLVSEYSCNFEETPDFTDILLKTSEFVETFVPIKLSAVLKLIKACKDESDKADILKKIKKDIYTKEKIKEVFNSIIPENNRLLFFIDELDRCSPLFAIKLLERIKHYFDDDRITFIFSVNLKELSSTIRNVYGSTFNAEKYLERFFDYTLTMPKFEMENFCNSLMFETPSPDTHSIINDIVKILDLNLREVAKFMRNVKSFTNYYGSLQSANNYPREYLGAIGYAFFLLILPILGLISKDFSYKEILLSGNGFKVYYDLICKIKAYEIISKNLYEIDGIKFDEGFNVDKMSELIYSSFVKEYANRNSSQIQRFCGLNKIFKKALDFPSNFSNQFELNISKTNK